MMKGCSPQLQVISMREDHHHGPWKLRDTLRDVQRCSGIPRNTHEIHQDLLE